MHITFLLHNAFAVGGTTRTTFNLAAALSARHQVHVVSVFQDRARPRLDPPPGIEITALVDRRTTSPDSTDARSRQGGRHFPRGDSRHHQYHRLAEDRLREWFATCSTDVVISTRAGLNVLLARFGPTTALRIAQEHLVHDALRHSLRRAMRRWYPALDAVVTMTRADAAAYRTGLGLRRPEIRALPNSVPPPEHPLPRPTGKIVMAAGRLTRVKRYDLLIDAFTRIGPEREGWQLHIYGSGPVRQSLETEIDLRDMGGHIRLMGQATPLAPKWNAASLAAVTSAQESFGMTLIEAMAHGVPVVSTDCPHGPREIIRDGTDGRLVPRDDVPALSAALAQLMDDQVLREAMGRNARERAQSCFTPVPVARRYEILFDELQNNAGAGAARPVPLRSPRRRSPLPVLRATAGIIVRGLRRRLLR
ncbi:MULTISPECIES: glycosyltransferase family 4 protein [unclassified Streptomyces]|uniref:glycosyltransferase family 4 protein n=1 Tax=unclassified Streptomyces TaxID=2593676 RepID=UPI002E2D32B8|nr:glycosyltransferase family 4 protein [Streptomyces sp. NBC_00228]